MSQPISNVVGDKSLSQILTNARTQRERLNHVLVDIINIRRQLDGDFPAADSNKKMQEESGLVGAVLTVQAGQDDVIEDINNHISVIHNLLGSHFHPNCQDDKEDQS